MPFKPSESKPAFRIKACLKNRKSIPEFQLDEFRKKSEICLLREILTQNKKSLFLKEEET